MRAFSPLTFWLIAFGLLINVDKLLVPITIARLQSDWGWSAAQAGDLVSAVYVAFILTTLPAGPAISRFGTMRCIRLSLLLVVAGSLLFYGFGVTGAAASLPLALVAARFVTGLGYVGYTTATPKLVADNYAFEARGSVQGVVLATVGLGAVVSFTAGASLLTREFTVYAGLALLFALLLAASFLLKGRFSPAREETRDGVKLSAIWRERNTLILAALMLVIDFVAMGVTNWLPTLLAKRYALSSGATTGVLVGFALTMAVGIASAAPLRKRFFTGRESGFITLCALLSAALLYLALEVETPAAGIGALLAANVMLTWCFGLVFVLPFEFVKKAELAGAVALINLGGFAGGILQGALIGRLLDAAHGSFTPVLALMAVSLAGAAALTKGLKPARETERPGAETGESAA